MTHSMLPSHMPCIYKPSAWLLLGSYVPSPITTYCSLSNYTKNDQSSKKSLTQSFLHEGIFDVTVELLLNLQSSKSSHMWLLPKDWLNRKKKNDRAISSQMEQGKRHIRGKMKNITIDMRQKASKYTAMSWLSSNTQQQGHTIYICQPQLINGEYAQYQESNSVS